MPLSEQVLSGQVNSAGWLELILKLALVVLLIYATAFLLQKRNLRFPFGAQALPGVPPSEIRTVAVHPLTSGVSLYLVEVENRRLLLSVSAQSSAQLLLDLGGETDES
ncbi:hypothetical protein COW36_12470 [bacterium (Candidatus Blackallbacteria) CG17_big_fil_post_rev_8_21_14_2_50_48_46]|uniref:Flagellar protein n=1 Tax=bacterium (Candidatus Blackallbacteria) CG17_big_fil_post_rev_8_21_14_2_50_48_46 TaxID=2014261 RepID=A0A2M7G3Y7_9BACT|nr:MAG: hypothetical protein COW64_02790 [bacterium (Candidatus Blackallbacteria) CG18_big_fil_WC_8_21_14_2_50_49_26]PIW16575.1 MAG: hypothetical protein COW36_12470 [bacterium (Candidatus Blackallbacteria) CG17_big_fil_post_rev_8_21_14_2_50_48_46]PIW46083.1 MAG: hypothetical protein COW20_17735 [bacterium (Candidatus Blackallbacteria) CG13_big_fil_rev_8_21_14_2_50_49_14]